MDRRNYSISAIRFISMLMIIACHILQGLQIKWAFWVNVGVQLFFFVSGFLYGKKRIVDAKKFYVKRIKRVLFPYIIVLAISLLLEFFVLKNHYPITKIVGCFMGFGAFVGNISILSHTWFVSYILLCYLLVPILQNIFNCDKFKNNFFFLIFVTVLIQMFQKFGVINAEASWLNNFVFGYFYSKCCNEKKQETIFNTFMFVMFFIIIPFAIIYQEQIQVNLPSILNSNANTIINYGHVVLGSVLFIVFYKIMNSCHIGKNIILDFSDKYSYYIYLVHQIFILNSFSVLFLTKSLFINILLILLFSILSAMTIKVISDVGLMITEKIFCKSKKTN